MKFNLRLPRLLSWLFFFMALGVLPWGMQAGLAKPPDAGRSFDYQLSSLDNGLQVITLEDHSCPIVSVQVWYHVGSKNEDAERQGFAHMFEHMMFRGTDRLGPTDHFDLIRRTGGSTNAYTSFDTTVYLELLPANQLELALWLEAERMAFLRVDQESFDTERKVVEEERRMGLNRPFGTLAEQMMAELFAVHPYRWTPIGKIAHLRAATVEELRAFWNRYYVPNNATLIIVGDIKHEEARRCVERYFGWIPRGAAPPKVTVREPLPTAQRRVTIRENSAPVPLVGIAYPSVAAASEDRVPLELLSTILAGGESSRLHRELVAEKQLAVAVQTISATLEQDGYFGLIAVMGPAGGDPREIIRIIESQVDRVRRAPVGDRELTKAKNQMLKGLVTQNLTISSKTRALGTAAVVQGDVARVNRQLADVQRVTVDDVQRVARQYLAPQRSLLVNVPRNLLGTALTKILGGLGKKEESAAKKPAAKGLAATVTPPRSKDYHRPADFPQEPPIGGLLAATPRLDHTRHQLDNGMTVLVVPNHEVPFVSVELSLRAGSWAEVKPGAASLAMQMPTKGTAKHTEAELADELETYAIALSGSVGKDSASLAASCTTDQLERAVQLLAETARTATFPPDEFDKLRKQVRTQLAIQSAEPAYIAGRELNRRLYGGHPYARTLTGELKDVDALSTVDLKQWWQRCMRPEQAVMIFAGDIDDARAVALCRAALGDWQVDGPGPNTDLPAFPSPVATRVYLVDRPGSVQSQIGVAQLGFPRNDPGFFTSRLVSDYFGGAFDSWLNAAVRVREGLTYTARGGFVARRFGGAFRVSTFTKTESTAAAVQVVLDEIDHLRSTPPTDKELAKRQTYYLGSYAMKHETPQQVAGDLWLIESYGLPADHFTAMLTAIRKTTAQDCQRLAQQAIDPNQLVIVVVGDATKIHKDLTQIAPVTVVKQ